MGGFIPGFLTLLRFQAHHRHILGRALPKLKGHMSLPGPPPGPHDRPDSVTPLRPRQPAPPSLLKTAPLGPGHPSCPEAAEASIPPMSDSTSTAMMEPGQHPKSCVKTPHNRMAP
ncbi:hypothetical protein ABFV05_006143 [Capra hircus]